MFKIVLNAEFIKEPQTLEHDLSAPEYLFFWPYIIPRNMKHNFIT